MESAILASSGLQGVLNYLGPVERKPFHHVYDPPPGQPKRLGPEEPHLVTIEDGRPLARAGALSLDRQGFLLHRHRTGLLDLYNDEAVERDYYPEMERLVREVTGAARVLVFDHTIRTAVLARPDGSPTREPVHRVHNDYTLKSAPQRVRDLLPDEAEELLQRRFAIVNVWRPIRAPLLHLPLALCDAQSLAPEDVVASDLIYPDRVGETYSIRYNPAHRWFYFPAMRRDEVVLIKCFDSDPARACFSAHTAFEDPTTPADAPPRESIEIRTLAFFA